MLVKGFVGTLCSLSKFGIGKNLCEEFNSSIALGEGNRAYIDGNYEYCYQVLCPYLKAEDDQCFGGIKYQLALLFYYGLGVSLNRAEANRLFEESAALGWEDAQNYLSQFEGQCIKTHNKANQH